VQKNQNGKYLIIEEYKPEAALTFGKKASKDGSSIDAELSRICSLFYSFVRLTHDD
jgi:hypothetical protein